jgi:TATA-binding protein-associated factor
MGRLVGIPHFLDEVSFIEEKHDASILRRVKKYDDDGVTFLSEQLQIVRRLQRHCQGYFLRRSPTSVDFQGQILLPLPPYHEIIGIVDLTARELTIIQERAKAAKAMYVSLFFLNVNLTA